MIGWEDDFEVLPDTTQDETGPGWGEDYPTDDDRRLLEDRPPHWE